MGESRAVSVNDEKAAALRSIAATRREMSETVGAIEERLSPAHFKEQMQALKEEAVEQFHDAKERVKAEVREDIATLKHEVREATIGKVEHMMERTSETVKQTGSNLVDTVRDNPIPLALIGLGVGLLFANRAGRTAARPHEDVGIQANLPGELEEGDGARSFVTRGKEAASNAVERATETTEAVAVEARDRAKRLARRTRERATYAKERGLATLHRGEERIGGFAHDNPLAVGAIVMAVGAAVGLALPSTRFEDRLVGRTRQRVVSRIEGAAREALDKAENKASEALRSSGNEPSMSAQGASAIGGDFGDDIGDDIETTPPTGTPRPQSPIG